MPDPNQRADHSAAKWLGLLENNFPDPGMPGNPDGKEQNASMREAGRALHREKYPELYPSDPLPPSRLLTPEDFTNYVGAYRPPSGDAFTYSKGAASHIPGQPDRMLLICHDHDTRIAEIEVPELRKTSSIADLLRATVKTPATEVAPWNGIRDVEIYDGKLYGHSAAHYEYTRAPKHFAAPYPLVAGQAAGQWYVGQDPPVPHINTNEYLFRIDPQWAAEHAPGMVLACGRHREGQAASGPSIIAFRPNASAPPDSVLQAIPLLLYGRVNESKDKWMENHFKADDWLGAAWIRAGSKEAIIIIGEKGFGQSWYGWEYRDASNNLTRVVAGSGQCANFPNDGIPCKSCEDEPAWCAERGLEGGNRGYCADGYEMVGLLFDPAQLAKVAHGELETWEPQPYAKVVLTPYLLRAQDPSWYFPGRKIQLGGVAWNPETLALDFTERSGSGGQIVIHRIQLSA